MRARDYFFFFDDFFFLAAIFVFLPPYQIYVLLLFFPLAFTNTCTKELCSVRDNIAWYNNANAKVLGISIDSLHALAKFKEEQKLQEIQSKQKMLKEEVDEEDIAEVVSKWTGIPVSRLMEGEIDKLVHMEDRLKERVVIFQPLF